MTAALIAAGACAAATAATPAHALQRTYDCDNMAPNTWCQFNEQHSWAQVISGQAYFVGSPGTSSGWWCSKIVNYYTGIDYARVCDFAYAVSSAIYSPPSSHFFALSANGNNGTYQHVQGLARTPSDVSD